MTQTPSDKAGQDRGVFLDLAARCEVSDGADRALADEIMLAVGWQRREFKGTFGWITPDGRQCAACHVPDPTTSLDAAMPPTGFGRVILNIAEDGITTAIIDGTQAVGTTAPLATMAARLRVSAYRAAEGPQL